jgi:hypothetical protein
MALLPGMALCGYHGVVLRIALVDIGEHVVSDVAEVALSSVSIRRGRNDRDHESIDQRLHGLVHVSTAGAAHVYQLLPQGRGYFQFIGCTSACGVGE